jgi:PAS domain-containing protein
VKERANSFASGISWGRLRRSGEPEQLLAAFFGASTVGLAILDDQLRYQAINNTLAAMNGVPTDAHLGRTLEASYCA